MKNLGFCASFLAAVVLLGGQFGGGAVVNSVAGSISISPASVTLHEGAEQVFHAKVSGSTLGVTWAISSPCDFGPYCRGAILSRTPTSATYRAPLHPVGTPPQIRIVATSKADPTKSARAAVTVVP
jgi:hypothetical protein